MIVVLAIASSTGGSTAPSVEIDRDGDPMVGHSAGKSSDPGDDAVLVSTAVTATHAGAPAIAPVTSGPVSITISPSNSSSAAPIGQSVVATYEMTAETDPTGTAERQTDVWFDQAGWGFHYEVGPIENGRHGEYEFPYFVARHDGVSASDAVRPLPEDSDRLVNAVESDDDLCLLPTTIRFCWENDTRPLRRAIVTSTPSIVLQYGLPSVEVSLGPSSSATRANDGPMSRAAAEQPTPSVNVKTSSAAGPSEPELDDATTMGGGTFGRPVGPTTWAPQGRPTWQVAPAHAGALDLIAAGVVLLSPIFWALYRRVRRDSVLKCEARRRVFEFVQATPGGRLTAVAKATDQSIKTSAYHLRILEEFGLITAHSWKATRLFFPNHGTFSARERDVVAATSGTTRRSIIAAVQAAPGVSGSELARRLDLTRAGIKWHTDALRTAGIVTSRRDGGRVRYYPIVEDLPLPATKP